MKRILFFLLFCVPLLAQQFPYGAQVRVTVIDTVNPPGTGYVLYMASADTSVVDMGTDTVYVHRFERDTEYWMTAYSGDLVSPRSPSVFATVKHDQPALDELPLEWSVAALLRMTLSGAVSSVNNSLALWAVTGTASVSTFITTSGAVEFLITGKQYPEAQFTVTLGDETKTVALPGTDGTVSVLFDVTQDRHLVKFQTAGAHAFIRSVLVRHPGGLAAPVFRLDMVERKN